MMCHRSPLTVQGRSPLLLLLFIVLSSLSFSHPSLTPSLLCCSFLHLSSFIPLSRCLPMPVIFHLSLSLHFPPPFTYHHLYPSIPPLFFQSICSLFLPRPSFIGASLHFCSCRSLLSPKSIFNLLASLKGTWSDTYRFTSPLDLALHPLKTLKPCQKCQH